MTTRTTLAIAACLAAVSVSVAARGLKGRTYTQAVGSALEQRAGSFVQPRDHAAIAYSTATGDNAVTQLMARMKAGATTLAFEPTSGYLRSLLDALAVPLESQVLVYSETSFQSRKINRKNPRAVYFSDRVAVGFVRGGDILEIAAFDGQQGTIFYQLAQAPTTEITRNDKCLSCHLSWDTRGVPGPMVLSVFPRKSDNDYANGGIVDHHTPISDRWGGWYVTGAQVPRAQLGNLELLQPALAASGPKPVPAPKTVEGLFDLTGYLTPHSDPAALLVLEHQAHAINLITRAGWEYRVAGSPDEQMPARVQEAVDELTDYLLFVDEARLPSPVRGASGLAERFAAMGPKDAKGRSLRELQLQTRLARYPLSFMIYSPGFEGLPPAAKGAVVAKITSVLRGEVQHSKYAHLTPEIRPVILELLHRTAPPSIRHFL